MAVGALGGTSRDGMPRTVESRLSERWQYAGARTRVQQARMRTEAVDGAVVGEGREEPRERGDVATEEAAPDSSLRFGAVVFEVKGTAGSCWWWIRFFSDSGRSGFAGWSSGKQDKERVTRMERRLVEQ
ncbi:uncharacterized protein PAC_04533 [Phialocephala subalpina]|uniref:Uncharacterized protein n=1 Tax=Phialocephala subalpina TaxID=576137 RepID=A0A1L7WPE5_9HELO|nr:uncharacterized protein PAC_04533 [Phialocephala subalpina]